MALSHIWRQGWEVFVPSYGNLPLENDMQVTIDHGTTIYIQDDWFLPIFHHSSSEDFLSIAQWGADVAADGVPPDTPWGPEAVQVICEGQSCLFEHVADETDLELLGRIQEVLRLSMDSPMLVRPSYQPRLPTFGGIVLSEILCLLPYGLKDTEVVVFLDKRKACQGWDAVHLASPQIPNADMVDILQLQIPRVFGYKLHIEGGRAFPDFLQVSHGQILEIEIVPETDAFDYEGCEEEDDCDSSDTELDPNTPDGRWCDDHSRGRPPSDHHGDGSYLVVRHQRHEDRPRSRSRSPFGGNTQTRTPDRGVGPHEGRGLGSFLSSSLWAWIATFAGNFYTADSFQTLGTECCALPWREAFSLHEVAQGFPVHDISSINGRNMEMRSMWNCAFSEQDALDEGKCGDTPSKCFHCSRHEFARSKDGGTSNCRAPRRGTNSICRWGTGMIMCFLQMTQGTAVLLPILHDHMETDPIDMDPAGTHGHIIGRSWDYAQRTNASMACSIARPDISDTFVRDELRNIESARTIIDEAKGEGVWQLCAEIASLLNEVAQNLTDPGYDHIPEASPVHQREQCTVGYHRFLLDDVGWIVSAGNFDIVGPDLDVSREAFTVCTVIDAARNEPFWRLCGELGAFLYDINSQSAQGCPDVQCAYHSSKADCDLLLDSANPCHERSQPHELSLERLLECNSVNEATCHMTCETNLEMLEWLQEGYQLGKLSCEVEKLGELHDNSTQALSCMRVWCPDVPFEEVKLFTDGSFHDRSQDMAWAVVAIVRWRDEWLFAGLFSGRVCLNDWDESVMPSPYIAEVFALFHAMMLTSNCPVTTTIMYDCTSAAEVAQHASKQFGHISQQMSALAAILRELGRWPAWGHVKGHAGDPFNELADSAAKAVCRGQYAHPPHEEDRISVAISEGWLVWLWPHVAASKAPSSWPFFDHDGRVYETNLIPHAPPDCESSIGSSFPQGDGDSPMSGACFDINLATYNCLSLKLTGQVDCIEAFCVRQQLHVVGFQETKVQWNGAAHTSHFLRFSSAANQQGLEGCQLWFRKGAEFGTCDSGSTFGWDFSSFAVIHESERCLAVSAKAGGLEFVCVTAHARTTVSKDSEVHGFWDFLSGIVARFPPKAIRLFFLDANAHFDASVHTQEYYLPTNLNAQLLREFVHAHSLVMSDLWSPSGEAIYTWISHQGQRRCLDYIAVPQCFRGYFQVQGSLDVLDRFAGIDHLMLWATLRFHQVHHSGMQRHDRFDCEAMCTHEGQAKLDSIFRNMPCIHWSMHASQHWNIMCEYLQDSCRRAFPAKCKGPYKPHIDFQTWELLGEQKHVRGVLRFRRAFIRKQVLFMCFRAWGSFSSEDHAGRQSWVVPSSVALMYKHHNFNVATLWRRLRVIKQGVAQALQVCQANRVRECFAAARSQGPRAFAQLLASITKKGRRFKAPKLLPPLVDDCGNVMTNKAAVLEKLGDFFATAEKAQKMTKQEYHNQAKNIPSPTHEPWRAADFPHVGVLANAFRKLKNGKAPGISGLPPEVFSQASQQAAMAFFPLFLKGMFRHEFASGLLGASIAIIPKPNKSPHSPSGWRSIALQECVSKAIASMFRGELVRAFTQQADTAQLGGRPKGPLGVPAHLIQAHVRRMASLGRSAAVIFWTAPRLFTVFSASSLSVVTATPWKQNC